MTYEDKKAETKDKPVEADKEVNTTESSEKTDHLIWDKMGNLPLLPLRGVVIYPNVLLSLDEVRERSILALQEAMENENELI